MTLPTTVPPPPVAVPTTGPLTDVYGQPLDTSVTYTVPPRAPPPTAAPTTPPQPTQPPTTVCRRKNPKKCRP